MNHLSDIICITCCGSASTQNYYSFQCEKRKHSICPYLTECMSVREREWVCVCVSLLYNMLPTAWNTEPELLQAISHLLCRTRDRSQADYLHGNKRSNTSPPACTNIAHTCTYKYIDAHTTMLLYQRQTLLQPSESLAYVLSAWLPVRAKWKSKRINKDIGETNEGNERKTKEGRGGKSRSKKVRQKSTLLW